MNDAERKPKPEQPIESLGPFVAIAQGVWVNANHVSSVAGTADPNKCWVTTLSTGTDQDASYAVDTAPEVVLVDLVNALQEWEMNRGEQWERGRLEVADEVQRR